ncbi:hypothetical protein KS4_28020 [Poriferisphaera corsica]|uniref:PEP-CTERM protein-sorting domain-containing protein n=1 Tax=Poriferisphaera corsica TaxID=2528020 RepID=A0A517YWW5_9BACT|nr:hypothetical protein [Poriferisphaera corsica]QDU34728.1 hypothetical protein KS4_28020 [Poriferisphaera corsica]
MLNQLRVLLCGVPIVAGMGLSSIGVAASFERVINDTSTFSKVRVTDMSDDGRVVVGYVDDQGGFLRKGFRWEQGKGVEYLGYLNGADWNWMTAYGVSGDGNVVVGSTSRESNTGLITEASKWVENQGVTMLGHLAADGQYSVAVDVSDDGNVIAGIDHSQDKRQAFRWTVGDGLEGLGWLSDDAAINHSVGLDLSGDGATLVGLSTRDDGSTGYYRYQKQNDVMEDLGINYGHSYDYYSGKREAAVNNAGDMIAGTIAEGFGGQAFRWIDGEGATLLGGLDESNISSYAYDISDDGSFVVGASSVNDGSTYRQDPFVWDEVNGMRSIETLLKEHGLTDALAGWDLMSASQVSADGMTFSGWGFDASGAKSLWIATIPEPGVGLVLLGGMIGLAMKRK